MDFTKSKSFSATIYVAGDLHDANSCVREFCMEGLCVSVTPSRFIYSFGAEDGVAIGIINYPRFPKKKKEIKDIALRLAERLIVALSQRSCSVVFPDETYWITNDKQGVK